MNQIKDLSELGINSSSKLLVVTPHPDDETAYMGGFLHKASKLGAHVKLICATAGEKSTLRNGLKPQDDLGSRRSYELERAVNIIGINDLEILKFGDSTLHEYVDDLTKYLRAIFNQYTPNLILTLEPNGIYGHPDHIALSQVVSRLQFETGFEDVLYATVGPHYIATDGEKTKSVLEAPKPTIPNFELILALREVMRKIMAFNAHKSQHVINMEFIKYWNSIDLLKREYFSKLT